MKQNEKLQRVVEAVAISKKTFLVLQKITRLRY